MISTLPPILALLVIMLAAFTQSMAGFGSGLVSMAFLPGLMGVRTATPVVALITGTLEIFLLMRYRSAFNLRAVSRLMLASILGIPVGVWALRGISERILLPLLGFVMAGYALYALLNFKLPRLEHPGWAYLAGFLAGILSGAYSVGGPPAIIYGSCRGWKPDEFKGNLQGFFLVNDIFSVIGHAIAGNLTPAVGQGFIWGLPFLAIGLAVGSRLDRYLNPVAFRRIVLLLLIVMGVRMMLLAFQA